MTQPMEQCDNCQKLFPESKIATHFGYCRRNIKKCPDCGQLYDINNKEEHDEQFHKKVACRFCKKELAAAEIKMHQGKCASKTQYCEYCELNVPAGEFDRHLKACEARTKPCEKCSKAIANKEYLVHLTTCPGPIAKQSRSYEDHIRSQQARAQRGVRNYNEYKNYDYEEFQDRKEVDFRKKEKEIPSTRVINDAVKINRVEKEKIAPQRVNLRPSGNGKVYARGVNDNIAVNPPTQARKEQKKKEEQIARNVLYKPQIRRIENPKPQIKKPEPQTNGGIKRPIVEPKREVPGFKNLMPPTMNYKAEQKYSNSPSSSSNSRPRQRIPIFDPKDYGGYDNEIPQEFIEESYGLNNRRNLQEFDESQEIQKAIMQSMEEKGKKHTYENIPKDLQSEELMRASWTKDFDIEKQKAIYEQIQRNANGKKGRR